MTPARLQRIRAALALRQPDLTVVTDEVHKGRNIAAILRTCDAVGIDQVHVVEPKSGYRPYKGTALGAQKWVDVALHKNLAQALDPLREHGFQLVAAALDKRSVDFREVNFTVPTALVLGAELNGLSEVLLSDGVIPVSIPMVGMVESFNVSVACAVILLEAQRQRLNAGLYESPRLDKATYEKRLFQWAHPDVAEFCDSKGLIYPEVDENGEIKNPSAWSRQVRTHSI